MIPRQPTRREIRVSSRPRWILIGAIMLAPIVATVSLNASARSAAVAFGERFVAWGWTASAPERPETDAGRASRSTQWTFLRDVGAKAASLVHMQTTISVPNVVGPSGSLHR
jgi:hypothetical protein